MAKQSQWVEAAVGAAVLVTAGWFLTYSLKIGGVRHQTGSYDVVAKFGEVGSLAPGASVRVAGVSVGAVSSIDLDPKTYFAVAHLQLDPKVKLPTDSSAKITSDGLLGGQHVVISPGAAIETLKGGDEIENTQGAVDLFGLIGQVLRPPTPAGPDAGASPPAASPTHGAQEAP
jgi:phospholipid/cholesterol/gamma-HCH transport system substrate-binding protein